jgi:DNA-3-methyladenine glycosylase
VKSEVRLSREFFKRDVLEVAPDLLGKELILASNETEGRYRINEVEAYRGTEDKACHASKGRTARTEVMYHEGGKLYLYFVYGMYWMLNIVTGPEDVPQAVLIRGLGSFYGPGILTRELGIDGSFYGEDLCSSGRIWIAGSSRKAKYICKPRVGIDYAGPLWKGKPWRYILKMT